MSHVESTKNNSMFFFETFPTHGWQWKKNAPINIFLIPSQSLPDSYHGNFPFRHWFDKLWIGYDVFCHLPVPSGLQVDCFKSLVSDSRRKSRHLYTFPAFHSSTRHDVDISSICAAKSTLFHKFTFDNIPVNDCTASKPPPTESCFCPSTKVPPCLTVWRVLKFVPSLCIAPSL